LAKIHLREKARFCQSSQDQYDEALRKLGPPSTRAEHFFYWQIQNAPPPSYHWQMISNLMLATVYHKLVPICSRFSPFSGGSVHDMFDTECKEPYHDIHKAMDVGVIGGANPDVFTIFDLVTSTDLARCSGSQCRDATFAVDAYQHVLQLITPFRTALSFDITRKVHWNEHGVDCSSDHGIKVDDMARIGAALKVAMAQIVEVANVLEVACVGPPRYGFGMEPM